MYILGINNAGYDTSCALMKDGKIVCAIAEERLSREKRTKKFPIRALKYCLESADISLNDVDHIVLPWNPGINLERMNTAYSGQSRFFPEFLYSVPNYLLSFQNETCREIEQTLSFPSSKIKLSYLEHHMCHAAFSYYTLGAKNALILSVDAWGEKTSTLLANGESGKITKIWEIEFPYSLGMFYQTMTQFLGFRPQHDEWKVMGAASYGDSSVYREQLRKLVFLTDDNKFSMDLSYFDYMSFTKKFHYSTKMLELLGERRNSKDTLTQRHFDIAAATQETVEEILLSLVKKNNPNRHKNLCLSGGVAMNCVANGRISTELGFDKVNVTFAPDDLGTCIGACFLFWHQNLNNTLVKTNVMSPYLSKDLTQDEIEPILKNYKLNYTKISHPAQTAARFISEGRIVGWYQGRMEFGQRALGNRSILADPRNPNMKDLINRAVKYREVFRPFAPSILHEYGNDYFEDYQLVPYMDKVLHFKDGKGADVPAVCHVDGTGRLQSVTKELNPLYWNLIEEFRKITNVPMVLNTSFNLNGEPIVHSVADAVRTFFSCGLDVLIIGVFQIEKSLNISSKSPVYESLSIKA